MVGDCHVCCTIPSELFFKPGTVNAGSTGPSLAKTWSLAVPAVRSFEEIFPAIENRDSYSAAAAELTRDICKEVGSQIETPH